MSVDHDNDVNLPSSYSAMDDSNFLIW